MRKEKPAGEELRTGAEDVAPAPRRESGAPDREPPFPIAGIGAAEGGLTPALELVRELGASPGLSAVLILPLANRPDDLDAVLRGEALMPVEVIADGMQPRVDHIYLVPAATKVTIGDRRFHVHPIDDEPSAPIDAFLSSLAEDRGERAIAVLLSGAGSDGLRGMRAVKDEGGITLAQDDDTAEYPQVPHAAALAGVDSVLPPVQIGRELLRMSPQTAELRRLPERELHTVFSLLQRGHDIDFTHYKPATIERRIRRRMSLRRTSNLKDYVAVLRENPGELQQLYNEILIRVTSFFRDPEVFGALEKEILPRILQGRRDEPVRIWVPGCATGEEVYSLAMLCIEAAGDLGFNCPFQIFGTDLSEDALERARQGLYAAGIVEEVSAERLRRFFTKADGGYRVTKAVRDCCIFARQNVAKDPPFSKLDLISCRNVMIYLGATLQRKVMGIFHYALRPDGYLLLGHSETIGNYGELFVTVDRGHKIYRKKAGGSRPAVDFTAMTARYEPARRIHMIEETQQPPANVFREADRIMLSRFSPPGVVVNENLDILQFRGRTSRFLEPAAGVASFNVLKMAREGLLTELRAAVEEARRRDVPVRREGVRVRTDVDTALVNLEIVPFLTPGKERYQLILFDEVVPVPDAAGGRKQKKKEAATPEDADQTARLERELDGTRDYLQSIIEEQEAMNEELRSANEEIQSSNEELQSTNEELETAKEELQSSNEELTTLNEELENRNEELAQANDDLVNLLTAVELPIMILDGQLQLRRFNPAAQRALSLVGGDIGRPLREVQTTLRQKSIDAVVHEVIETLEPRELDVQDREGTTFLLRICPYKTSDNRIDGAVLVLIDVDQFRRLKR